MRTLPFIACFFGLAACSPAPSSDLGATESAQSGASCLGGGAVDKTFECRVGRAAGGEPVPFAPTVYDFFGVNAGATGESDGAGVTHLRAGWVRIGTDPGDRDPAAHVATYAARVKDFHARGIKVLFVLTEGLASIPTNPDGSGMYAKDSCSTDPRVASLWPRCGCDAACVDATKRAWGIPDSGDYAPGSYMARFRDALGAFVASFGAGDARARPDVWEILNEPDNNNARAGHPYGTQLNVHVTGEILKIARRVLANDKMAFGALMMASSWRITKASSILAGGALFDYASYHTYVAAGQAVASVAQGVAEMEQAVGSKPLMMTEFGFDSAAPAGARDSGSAALEAFMREAWRVKRVDGKNLETVFLFSWADGDGAASNRYGVVGKGGECKASFAAFAGVAEEVARAHDDAHACD